MKKPIKLVLVSVTSLLVIGSAVAVNAFTSDDDQKVTAVDSPLVQQLEDHEQRITGAETDIDELKGQTAATSSGSTQTTTTSQQNPAPTTQTPTAEPPAPEPSPVVVSTYREISIDADTSDCEYTYSDSTTYLFHWKTSNPQGAWVTDGVGQNGHWVKTTNYSGKCDNSVLGQVKVS